ncbi:MAG: molybdenum cofactor biosynthesis protein MoaE [Aquincola tertiaricarbonis]
MLWQGSPQWAALAISAFHVRKVAIYFALILAWQVASGAPTDVVAAAQAAAPVSLLELEHYPGMTERAIEAMIDEAQRRFGIRGARVVHRIGPLALNEQIVLVAVAAAHRGEAFQACEFLMDYLKTQAPFWKKEHSADGARWVDARVADDAAAARWGLPATNLAGSVAGLPPALPAAQPA